MQIKSTVQIKSNMFEYACKTAQFSLHFTPLISNMVVVTLCYPFVSTVTLNAQIDTISQPINKHNLSFSSLRLASLRGTAFVVWAGYANSFRQWANNTVITGNDPWRGLIAEEGIVLMCVHILQISSTQAGTRPANRGHGPTVQRHCLEIIV